MQKITKKKIIVFGILIATIAIFFIAVKSCRKGKDNVYEYETVAPGTVQRTISVPGTVDIMDPYRLLGKASGMVTKILVDYNHEVSKGQLLAILDSTDIDQSLTKLGATLESTKLELAISQGDLESKRSMLKENLIAEKGVERAEYNHKTVQSKYKQILIDYENMRKMKANTRVLAPLSGVIISRNIEVNAPVSVNMLFFVIAPTLKKMRLTISIDESDIGQIKKGQEVFFTVSAFQDKTFRGKINQVRINPIMKGSVVTYESLVTCDNEELLLKPGMTATATIEISKRDNVLRVSNQAFIVSPVELPEEEKKNTIWRQKGGMAGGLPVEKVRVQPGLRGDNYTEIKSGLKKGEKVLIRFIKAAK
jgi:HlyD family secretion protein